MFQQFSVVVVRDSYWCSDSLCGGGRWLEEIELKDLFLPLVVIDKSKEVAENPDCLEQTGYFRFWSRSTGQRLSQERLLPFAQTGCQALCWSINMHQSGWAGSSTYSGWGQDSQGFLQRRRELSKLWVMRRLTQCKVSHSGAWTAQWAYLWSRTFYQLIMTIWINCRPRVLSFRLAFPTGIKQRFWWGLAILHSEKGVWGFISGSLSHIITNK